MGIFTRLFDKNQLIKNSSFIWDSKSKKLITIKNNSYINLDLIIAVDRQKKTLLENTLRKLNIILDIKSIKEFFKYISRTSKIKSLN